MRKIPTLLWVLPALAVLALLLAPAMVSPARAAQRAALTGTPTEPPTNTPTNTAVPPTPTNTAGPGTPTDTPVPGTPTDTPVPGTTEVVPPPPGSGGGPPTPTPDLALSKQADVSKAGPGDPVSYTITVLNRGPNSALDVVIADDLPEALEVVDISVSNGSSSSDGNHVTVKIKELRSGESTTIVVRTRVRAEALPADLVNTVWVESGGKGRLVASAVVSVPQPTPLAVPGRAAAPPPAAPQAVGPRNARLPRTGTLVPDGFEAVLAAVLAAGVLFCLSMAVRAYRR